MLNGRICLPSSVLARRRIDWRVLSRKTEERTIQIDRIVYRQCAYVSVNLCMAVCRPFEEGTEIRNNKYPIDDIYLFSVKCFPDVLHVRTCLRRSRCNGLLRPSCAKRSMKTTQREKKTCKAENESEKKSGMTVIMRNCCDTARAEADVALTGKRVDRRKEKLKNRLEREEWRSSWSLWRSSIGRMHDGTPTACTDDEHESICHTRTFI